MNAHSDERTDIQEKQPLRERLVAVKRDHILDAATQVFAAKGFEAATIREIVRLAGVADGSIYTYFKNKAALLLGILDRLNETEQRREHLSPARRRKAGGLRRAYMHHRFEVFSQIGFDAFRVMFGELLVNAELRDSTVATHSNPRSWPPRLLSAAGKRTARILRLMQRSVVGHWLAWSSERCCCVCWTIPSWQNAGTKFPMRLPTYSSTASCRKTRRRYREVADKPIKERR
jgi:AcrR family transcriptional regulator